MGFLPFLQQDAGCHNVTISAILGFLKISFIFIILICSLSEYLSQLYMQSWSQAQQKNCQKISGPLSKTLLLSHVHFPKVLLLTPHPFPQIGKYISYELRHIMANVLSDYNWWQLIWSRRRNSAPAFWIKAHLDTWTWAWALSWISLPKTPGQCSPFSPEFVQKEDINININSHLGPHPSLRNTSTPSLRFPHPYIPIRI